MKKRFIAGANCPKCKNSDTLIWWQENGNEFVSCVECDYSENKSKDDASNDQPSNNGEIIGIYKI